MADSQKYKPLLPDNPLCGIDTYKDTLNLATGSCTRQIEKLVLTGDEYWVYQANNLRFVMTINDIVVSGLRATPFYCTHYIPISDGRPIEDVPFDASYLAEAATNTATLNIKIDTYTRAEDFKAYLAAQYANGTPVTVWYILATPTTETIAVPSGLSGTEEGYLNQSGTPTPTNPIYPTANEVLIWEHSLRKLTTATDTLTTLPADLYPNAVTATVGLKGNMSQTGTPTPTNPIQPSECGDRTGNLFDYNAYFNSTFISYNEYFEYATIQLLPNTTYTLSTSIRETVVIARETSFIVATTNQIPTTADGGISNISPVTITTENDGILNLYKRLSGGGIIPTKELFDNGAWLMLNSGSTPLPYEPYGYKIPISSASTTTPVYLGEVESTRRIKKLVLTGDEDWTLSYGSFRINVPDYYRRSGWIPICTHYQGVNSVAGGGDLTNGQVAFLVSASANYYIYICDTNCTSAADFKAYLAQQYSAGTPVCIWYVLAEPTTGTLNEPLRKIGDYADTVSGITIPTIAGANSFDVLTTLKPSEVTVNYKGWHTGAVHECDSGQWD